MKEKNRLFEFEKSQRQKLKLTQSDIARLIDIDYDAYRMSIVRRKIPKEFHQPLADVLQTTVAHLKELGMESINVTRWTYYDRKNIDDILPLLRVITAAPDLDSLSMDRFKEIVQFWKALPKPEKITIQILKDLDLI
jgi:hypothetical protein